MERLWLTLAVVVLREIATALAAYLLNDDNAEEQQ